MIDIWVAINSIISTKHSKTPFILFWKGTLAFEGIFETLHNATDLGHTTCLHNVFTKLKAEILYNI